VPEEINVEVTDVTGEWAKLLKKQYKRELAELSREYPHNRSLLIDFRKILNNKLAFALLRSPGKVIGISGTRSSRTSSSNSRTARIRT
jgi:replicative DNA helicase Mcm